MPVADLAFELKAGLPGGGSESDSLEPSSKSLGSLTSRVGVSLSESELTVSTVGRGVGVPLIASSSVSPCPLLVVSPELVGVADSPCSCLAGR